VWAEHKERSKENDIFGRVGWAVGGGGRGVEERGARCRGGRTWSISPGGLLFCHHTKCVTVVPAQKRARWGVTSGSGVHRALAKGWPDVVGGERVRTLRRTPPQFTFCACIVEVVVKGGDSLCHEKEEATILVGCVVVALVSAVVVVLSCVG
jgi:hypothetical protein